MMYSGLLVLLVGMIALYWACFLHISGRGGKEGRRFFWLVLFIFCVMQVTIYFLLQVEPDCDEMFCGLGNTVLLLLSSFLLVLAFPVVIMSRAIMYPTVHESKKRPLTSHDDY
jgi:hypothetical protein